MVNPEFKPFNFIIKSADKFSLFSDRGRIIDFSGSAMTTGYHFLDLQLETVSALVFKGEANMALTSRLRDLSGFEKVAYTNSGTEACDMALSRYEAPIISFEGAYHGRTFLTRRVSNGTGIDEKLGIVHLKFPEPRVSLKEIVSYNMRILEEASRSLDLTGSAIIVELIQSDGGEVVAPPEFISFLMSLKEKHGMKIIVDEVYTGMGRSGHALLASGMGLKADMICLGKGMAAGLPMGAVLYNGEWGLPTENGALGMLGGNEMACHAALKTLDSLTDERLEFVRKSGQNIIERIRTIRNHRVGGVRGMGFMIGVDLVDSSGHPDTRYAYRIRDSLAQSGVACGLVGESNNVLKITPPVLIDKETLEEGVEKILMTLEETV